MNKGMKKVAALCLATAAMGAWARPATIEGKLRVADVGRDGHVDYVCTLKSLTETYEVKMGFDPATKQLSIAYGYPLSWEKGRSVRAIGPYAVLEEKYEGKPTKTNYTLGAGGLHFVLTYTEGAALPEFTWGAGLQGYACR